MSNHTADCAIHGCEGWNGERICDCKTYAPLASPAVVTRVCQYGYQWCDGTNRHICEWCIKDLQAKVSELEAQLQQARFVIDNKQGIIDELERMRAGGKS